MHHRLALCAALLTLVVGCGGKKQEKTPSGKDRVTIVGSTWYGHLPVLYGMESGIFDKHGFAIEWKVVGKSADRVNAITSGRVQFASLGQIAMLTSMANGNRKFYWVGNQDIAPGFEGLVAVGVSDYAGLKGKKIGYTPVSSVDLTVRLLLKANGLDPDKDVQLLNMEPAAIPSALKGGSIQAGAVWEPHFAKLKALPGAKLLGLDTDTVVYKKFGTMTGPDVLIAGRQWIDEDPERARRFFRAYWEAVAAVKKDPLAALDKVFARHFKGADRKLTETNLKKFQWLTLADQKKVMSDQGLFAQTDFVLKMLKEIGQIKTVPDFREQVKLDVLPFESK